MTRRVARIVHRLIVWLLGLLGGIVAASAIAITFGAWRLSQGPVSLDVITPYLAKALANDETGITVSIDHTLLSFTSDSKLELVARGVHLAQRGGGTLTLPEFYIGLSTRAMLAGVIAPTRITLNGPVLRLERDTDGSIHVGLGADEAGVSDDFGARLIADLAKAPDEHGPLGYLVELGIHNATLTVDDRSLGVVWKAERADIVVHRGDDGIRGDMRLTADIGGRQTDLDGLLSYRIAAANLGLVLRFKDLEPAAWAAATGLAPLAAMELPIAGEVRASFDLAQRMPHDVSCDLIFGEGVLHDGAFVGGRLPIARGALHASYDPAAGRIDVGELVIDIGGPKLTVAGTVSGVGDGLLSGAWPQTLTIASKLELRDLPVDNFAGLWPVNMSPGTREFLTQQVHTGKLDKADMQLGLELDLHAGAAKTVQVDAMSGSFAYTNLTVDYFPPLPSVMGVSGTATFNRQRVDFVPMSGAIKGAKVTGGVIALSKLDTNDEQVAIDLAMNGPLRDVLEVLDSKPLRYARELGMDPSHVGGDFDARIKFAFPLLKKLPFSRVDFGAQATLDNIGIDQAMFSRDLTNGNLKMALDRNALQLDGTAKLGGVPLNLSWTYSLKAAAPVIARYVIHTELDDATRKSLGFDIAADRISGPIGIDVDYSRGAGRRADVVVGMDLKQATLALGELGWTKAAGVPATGKFRLQLNDDKLTAIKEGAIKGGGLDAQIAAAFSPTADGASLTRLDIARLAVGKTNVMGDVMPRANGGWRVQLTGSSLDASTLLAQDHDKTPASPTSSAPPLAIDASLDRLILGDQREASSVRGVLFRDGDHWQSASLDLTMSGGGTVSLRFGKSGGDHSFTLTSNDYGALLKLLDITDNVRGGHIQLTGRIDDRDADRVLRGHAEGNDYRIIGAPMFARLLSVASFSGAGALLSGEGIPFSRLTADFTYGGGKIAVKDMRATGSAIGINASGAIDYDGGTLDVSGTLAPAYAVNSALSNVPVLGKLLLGGEGQGLFGANFRVAGPLASPSISVNPLSAIAPGALRNLFLFDAPKPGTPKPEAANQN
jgi:hypothetical protein